MKPRVLVVDDSLTVRMDLGDALQAAGFDTELCADLAHARQLLARGPTDLIVLDLLLPDGDGIDLLKEVRAHPALSRVPVMLLSTEAEVHSRVQGMSAGADEYVGKPYDLGQLIGRARALARPAGPASSATPSAPRRVLLIEDSATFRAELGQLLAGAGYQVHEASTGEEGLALAAALRPDAVVVDGMLPGIDGVTVIRRLKSDAALRGTPCLLLTAADRPEDELSALEAGADAFARKTEDFSFVLLRLAALLRSVPAGRADARPSLFAPKRILAVDDSATYLAELGSQLRDEGYDTVLAHSGADALAFLATQPVDCILLDLIMPGLSGQETCRRIKEEPRWRDIPLVMLTASDDRAAMIAGINAGADDYIAKSADFGILKARLRAQLRRKHFEDENRHIREQLVRKETEARFQQLIHSNIIGVILTSLEGVVLEANDAFLDMVGYSRAELAAGQLHWDRITPPEWRDRARGALDRARNTGSTAPFESELCRKDGSALPILLGLVLLGGSDTMAGFVLDRTEQKLAEEKVRLYGEMLEQTNRELDQSRLRAEQESRFKSKFLANMSHELRTPLNAIIGFSELLEQEIFGGLNPRQKEYVGNVVVSGRHLLTLVNDILDLSKVEAGRMDLEREWTPLAVAVDAVEGIVRALANTRSIKLSVTLPPDLPDLYIDPTRIRQVLYNLLSNAIKFSPRGALVELTAAVDGKNLRVSCRDTGIGIRAEDMPRLFQEFEQIEPVSGTKPEGTGLGLALTKRLVEMHGGTISATSAPGEGSTFMFTLPMLRRDTGTVRSDKHPALATHPLVLVVEDDAAAAELIGGHLRSAGLAVLDARNADEALRLAREHLPAAITLDVLMPGFDGWAVLERLKQDPATRHIPVVIISVVDQPNRALLLGATDFLMKPVSRDVLLSTIEDCGVPILRVGGTRVLLAGEGNGDWDLIESHLRQAACEVRRETTLTVDAMTGDGAVDLVLLNLARNPASALDSMDALRRDLQALPLPMLVIVDPRQPRPAGTRGQRDLLSRSDALAPERLVRVVRQAVDEGRRAPSAWHAPTGLPALPSLTAALRTALSDGRGMAPVALVVVKAPLPRDLVAKPWPRLLRPHLLAGDYPGVLAEDTVAFVTCVSGSADLNGLPQRFMSLLEQAVGIQATGARTFLSVADGPTADDLLREALAWAGHAAGAA